jgi:acyl carrier protein
MEIAQRIRTYIVENFLFGDDQELSNSQSLLDAGVIDSTGVIELVTFLEDSFGVEVADDELVPENLDTIDNIAAFTKRKRSQSKAGLPTTE